MRDLELIYEQMYLSNHSTLNEGFFDNLRQNLSKILVPMAAAAGIAMVAGPTVVNSVSDAKMTSARGDAQQRAVTSQSFGNVFNRDDTIMSYLQKNPTFTITPRQFMLSRYGQDWNKILNNARQQQQNNPTINFWTNLTDQFLDTPVEVVAYKTAEEFQKATNAKASGGFSGHKVQISLNLGDTKQMESLGGVGNCMAHEFRHSLQKVHAKDSHKGVVPGVAYDAPGGGYVGNPMETGVRLGNLIQSYYNDTGKLITNSQEATKALERYGFKLNASPADIQNIQNIKVDGDVKQLRDLFYKTQQRSPERAAKFYEILTKQMPGIVYQTYQQSQNTA